MLTISTKRFLDSTEVQRVKKEPVLKVILEIVKSNSPLAKEVLGLIEPYLTDQDQCVRETSL
jgi:hypothetical protein